MFVFINQYAPRKVYVLGPERDRPQTRGKVPGYHTNCANMHNKNKANGIAHLYSHWRCLSIDERLPGSLIRK